jgi:hypothetical protein
MSQSKFSRKTSRRVWTGFFVTLSFFTGLLLVNIVQLLIDILTFIEGIIQ